MAGLKRHRSWHEDFTRNFFKLFSRSKSLDQEKTDTEPDNGEDRGDDGACGEVGEDETLLTPEPDPPTAPGAQTLERTDQDGAVEGEGGEGVVQGNAVRSPPPVTPPVPEHASPAPPADGFLRRLGSLFSFARAEPGGDERQSQPSVEAQGSGKEERADPGSQLRGANDGEGGEERTPPPRPPELSHNTLEPCHSSGPRHSSDLFRSAPVPEVTDAPQNQQEIQGAQLHVETETEEDGECGVGSPVEEEEEEERRRALACPPVVTHGTYRGLREVRRMRRQEVHLHSPISEGEEGLRGAGTDLCAADEGEVCAIISPTGCQERQVCSGASWVSDVTLLQAGSEHESCMPTSSFPICSNTQNPVQAEEPGSTAGLSALHTQTQSRTKPVGLEPDPPSPIDDVCAGGKDPGCLDMSGKTQLDLPVSETPPLEAESACETPPPFPLTAEALKNYTCLSDTDTTTNTNTRLADANITSDTLELMDVTSGSQQGGQGPEERHTPWATADVSGHTAWWHDLVLGDEAAQLDLLEEQPRSDKETLHVESVRMVDSILRNALAALEVIEASEREAEPLWSDEGSKSLVLPGDASEGASSLQRAHREHLLAQADGTSRLGSVDKSLGGQAQADGNRSTPSSGYESIAGSDTDIQSSAGVSAEVGSLIGAVGVCSEQVGTEREMEGSSVCPKTGRGTLHSSTSLLGTNLEQGEGSVRTETSDEILFQYALSDSNISHKTNITSVQSAISESLSRVNKTQVQCVLEEHVKSVIQARSVTGTPYAAKNNLESNKSHDALGLDSGDVSPNISKNSDLSQVESINERLSLIRVEFYDSEQPELSNKVTDCSDTEDQLALKSRGADEVTTPGPVHSESLKKPELVSQGLQNGHARVSSDCQKADEPSFVLVQTYLASVVEDVPDSETGERETVPAGPGLIRPLGSDASYLCSVTVDHNEAREPDLLAGMGAGRGGSRPAALPAPALPSPSVRVQAGELSHAPRGFAVISEEEETDAVFVNDTGPMLSPGARRARAYPFSLSPIYEEDSGREDCSREEALHVPPATGEEQRSVEQQASSILSLLQSVSERLLSSALDAPEAEEAREVAPEEAVEGMSWAPGFPRPLWDRYGNDIDTEEQESTSLPHHQLPGAGLSSEEDGIPSSNPDQHALGKHGENNRNSAAKTSDTPFYQCLKPSIVPTIDVENPLLCHNERSLTSSSVQEETGHLGKRSPRPTLLHVSEGTAGGGGLREVHGDVKDTEQALFPPAASIQARRGCWLLYVEPGFQGSCVLLEEGQTRESGPSAPLSVGSIRRAVKDDCIPEIHMHFDRTGESEPVVLHCDADHIEAANPVHLSDLSVRSGCWLAFDGAGFTGNRTLLEEGGSYTPLAHDSPISCVRSLRPLRMGGLRVRRPLDPKMVVYEKPLFQGQWRELLENTAKLGAEKGLVQIASLQVTGGVWVGYSCENYTGEQCVLEEGEFSDCTTFFSGPEQTLKSCRFLQADFVQPALCLSSSGEQLEILDHDVANLQLTAMKAEPDAIHVRRGVWVAYSGRSYSGQQCVLERGLHSGTLDWGSSQSSPLSIRPVRRELCGEKEPKFLLRAYSQPGFAGESREFESEVADCTALCPTSFRVILGSWLLYDEEGYRGNQFVLGEGLYPNLASCGSSSSVIRSFRTVPHTLSEPIISLYSLSSFEGLETVVDSPMESMENFFTQSLRVNSGLWVAYEFSWFKGRQMLLQVGEFPCWGEHSGWDTIGSLHPLRQRRAYLHVRSGAVGTALAAETGPGTSSPAKLCLRPADRTLDTQHWVYTQSMIKSRVDKSCLSVIGAKANVGARVALWNEHGRIHQKWSVNDNGTISSHLNHNLVLDRRGGSGTDKDHLILSEFCAGKASQHWDIEVL